MNGGNGVMCLHVFVMHNYSFKPHTYFIKMYIPTVVLRLQVYKYEQSICFLLFCHNLLISGIWYLGSMFEHNCIQTLRWQPTYNPFNIQHILHRYKQLHVLTHLSSFYVHMFAVMLVFNLVSKIQLEWITSRCTRFYVQQTYACRHFCILMYNIYFQKNQN
jgi:hypothetical protein